MDRSCQITDRHPTGAVPATVDAKTIFGPWAYLCDECLVAVGTTNPALITRLSEVK